MLTQQPYLPLTHTHTHGRSKKRSMTYLVHNKALFELYTARSSMTHFPQFSSTSAPAPVSAVTAAEGGRQLPWATLSDPWCRDAQRICKEKLAGPPAHSQRSLKISQITQEVLNWTTNPVQRSLCTLIIHFYFKYEYTNTHTHTQCRHKHTHPWVLQLMFLFNYSTLFPLSSS